MSPKKLAIAHDQVEELLSNDIIEESCSPWSSPILLVEKKNGKFRMCVDYRLLNKNTVPCAYPLPRIKDIFNRLKTANFISSLDLESGYHQIPMARESIPLTAFTVPGKGLFQFKRMPSGLCNAPATFQSTMEHILRPVLGRFVFVYLDDIIIFSETYDEHVRHLKEVFRLLRDAGLRINWEKCQFLQPYVEYLGHVVGQGEIRVIPKKVEAVLNLPPPTRRKEVRSFLGLVNWYRSFIKNCAGKSAPLSRLLQKDVKFVWTEREQNAFDLLKKCLTEAPVLVCPDFNQKFEIHVDASLIGVGAVLIQRKNRKERVVAYASKTLNRQQRNWSTTERELYAIVFGIETFREYVDGSKFLVVSDHAPLQWLHSLKNPSGKLARWITKLGQFNFEVIHRKGKHNVVPDCLSRAPYHELPVATDVNDKDIELSAVDLPPNVDFSIIQDVWYRDKILANPNSYPAFSVRDHLIFKKALDLETKNEVSKLVIPSDFRNTLLEIHHDSVGAHLGVKKTFMRLQKQYYWPLMYPYVKSYIDRCELCQRYKAKNTVPPGLMAEYERSFKPGTAYSLDIVGPLPMTHRNNRFIITAVDLASRWPVAIPVPSGTSRAIARVLEDHIIWELGCPEFIVVDNGTPFTGKALKNLCDKYKIRIHHVPKYCPQTNQVERHHRTLGTALAIFSRNDTRDWDNNLKCILHAIRNSVSESTNFSPSLLTFGREMPMPCKLFRESDDGKLLEFDADAYKELLNATLRSACARAAVSVNRARNLSASRYNLHRRPSNFQVGDLVLRRDHAARAGKKLSPKYIGPFVISEIFSDSQVRLKTPRGKDTGRWHVSSLKLFK